MKAPLGRDRLTSALWTFDQDTGASVVDTLGTTPGNMITGVDPTSTIVGGLFGRARSFNGSSYISMSNSDSLNSLDMTLEVVFNVPTPQVGYSTLMSKLENNSGVYSGYQVMLSPAGIILSIGTRQSGIFSSLSFNCTIQPSTWHYLAITVASDGITAAYLDGYHIGSYGTPFKMWPGEITLTVGSSYDNTTKSFSNFFRGLIDSIRISSTERSPQYIALTQNKSTYSGVVA